MKSYKKAFIALGVAFGIITQTHAVNLSEYGPEIKYLDSAGTEIMFELYDMYNNMLTKDKRLKSYQTTYFNDWNDLLEHNVKLYIEKNSKIVGIKDENLTKALKSLLAINNLVIKKIKETNAFNTHKLSSTTPPSEMEIAKYENILLAPLETAIKAIEVMITDLKKESYYVPDKKKAKEMLLLAFDLMHKIATAAMLDTATILHQ